MTLSRIKASSAESCFSIPNVRSQGQKSRKTYPYAFLVNLLRVCSYIYMRERETESFIYIYKKVVEGPHGHYCVSSGQKMWLVDEEEEEKIGLENINSTHLMINFLTSKILAR